MSARGVLPFCLRCCCCSEVLAPTHFFVLQDRATTTLYRGRTLGHITRLTKAAISAEELESSELYYRRQGSFVSKSCNTSASGVGIELHVHALRARRYRRYSFAVVALHRAIAFPKCLTVGAAVNVQQKR